MVQQPPVGQGLLNVEASPSHSDTPHSAGIWTSCQPDAEVSTWEHTTPTRDRHLCPHPPPPGFEPATPASARPL